MVDQRFPVSVHIMTYLAFQQKSPETKATSDFLASSIRTNPTVIRRLISLLVQAGLVHAYKGKSGGVELAKRPQEITLKDIYTAVLDKKLICNPDKAPKKACPVSCSMKELMGDVIEGFEKNSMSYLASIKLSDLVQKVSD